MSLNMQKLFGLLTLVLLGGCSSVCLVDEEPGSYNLNTFNDDDSLKLESYLC